MSTTTLRPITAPGGSGRGPARADGGGKGPPSGRLRTPVQFAALDSLPPAGPASGESSRHSRAANASRASAHLAMPTLPDARARDAARATPMRPMTADPTVLPDTGDSALHRNRFDDELKMVATAVARYVTLGTPPSSAALEEAGLDARSLGGRNKPPAPAIAADSLLAFAREHGGAAELEALGARARPRPATSGGAVPAPAGSPQKARHAGRAGSPAPGAHRRAASPDSEASSPSRPRAHSPIAGGAGRLQLRTRSERELTSARRPKDRAGRQSVTSRVLHELLGDSSAEQMLSAAADELGASAAAAADDDDDGGGGGGGMMRAVVEQRSSDDRVLWNRGPFEALAPGGSAGPYRQNYIHNAVVAKVELLRTSSAQRASFSEHVSSIVEERERKRVAMRIVDPETARQISDERRRRMFEKRGGHAAAVAAAKNETLEAKLQKMRNSRDAARNSRLMAMVVAGLASCVALGARTEVARARMVATRRARQQGAAAALLTRAGKRLLAVAGWRRFCRATHGLRTHLRWWFALNLRILRKRRAVKVLLQLITRVSHSVQLRLQYRRWMRRVVSLQNVVKRRITRRKAVREVLYNQLTHLERLLLQAGTAGAPVGGRLGLAGRRESSDSGAGGSSGRRVSRAGGVAPSAAAGLPAYLQRSRLDTWGSTAFNAPPRRIAARRTSSAAAAAADRGAVAAGTADWSTTARAAASAAAESVAGRVGRPAPRPSMRGAGASSASSSTVELLVARLQAAGGLAPAWAKERVVAEEQRARLSMVRTQQAEHELDVEAATALQAARAPAAEAHARLLRLSELSSRTAAARDDVAEASGRTSMSRDAVTTAIAAAAASALHDSARQEGSDPGAEGSAQVETRTLEERLGNIDHPTGDGSPQQNRASGRALPRGRAAGEAAAAAAAGTRSPGRRRSTLTSPSRSTNPSRRTSTTTAGGGGGASRRVSTTAGGGAAGAGAHGPASPGATRKRSVVTAQGGAGGTTPGSPSLPQPMSGASERLDELSNSPRARLQTASDGGGLGDDGTAARRRAQLRKEKSLSPLEVLIGIGRAKAASRVAASVRGWATRALYRRARTLHAASQYAQWELLKALPASRISRLLARTREHAAAAATVAHGRRPSGAARSSGSQPQLPGGAAAAQRTERQRRVRAHAALAPYTDHASVLRARREAQHGGVLPAIGHSSGVGVVLRRVSNVSSAGDGGGSERAFQQRIRTQRARFQATDRPKLANAIVIQARIRGRAESQRAALLDADVHAGHRPELSLRVTFPQALRMLHKALQISADGTIRHRPDERAYEVAAPDEGVDGADAVSARMLRRASGAAAQQQPAAATTEY